MNFDAISFGEGFIILSGKKRGTRERGETIAKRGVRATRGQAGVEFMAIVGLLGLMLIGVYAFTNSQRADVEVQSTVASGWSICGKIAAEASTAIGVGDGYERIFYLPSDVNGDAYSISVTPQEQSVFVSWDSYSCRASLLTSQVVGAPHAGTNKVKNDKGTLYFS